MTVAAILLAAGASRRMGAPKPLLPWGDGTLLEWELAQLLASCVDEIVVVVGSRSEAVRRSLGEASRYLVFNPRWPQGRATSLAAGAKALLEAEIVQPEVVVIQNVDQPTRAEIIDRLVQALCDANAEAVQPSYRDDRGREHGGHPVVVSGALLPALAAARDEDEGLRGVLRGRRLERLDMSDEPAVRLDLDTPDALPEARRILGVG
jgi:molybdenum cofactor cytidylyltransferase